MKRHQRVTVLFGVIAMMFGLAFFIYSNNPGRAILSALALWFGLNCIHYGITVIKKRSGVALVRNSWFGGPILESKYVHETGGSAIFLGVIYLGAGAFFLGFVFNQSAGVF
jgi:uncharacterized membrane protein HdeD (DUF308 family)